MWGSGAISRFGNTSSLFGSNSALGTNGTSQFGNGPYYGNPNYSANAATQAFNGYANSLGYYSNSGGFSVTPPGYNRSTTYYGNLNAAAPGQFAPMNNGANVTPGYSGYSPYYGNNGGYGLNGISQYPQSGSAAGNVGYANPVTLQYSGTGTAPAAGTASMGGTAPAAGSFGWF
jgi:hypothetical protein